MSIKLKVLRLSKFLLILIFFFGQNIIAQNKKAVPEKVTISGTVKNKLDELMKRATVENLNTGQTVLTDNNGRYNIDATQGDSLSASFIGYNSFKWIFSDLITFNITLEPVSGSLNEVVIVGYGKQRKISQIGAQSMINTEELKQPIANVGAGLAGRLAGLVAVQRTGEPGHDDADLWIRGIATMNNSRPLILVDGVERSLSNLNYDDIASFSILKDASATAVYGVRGANGVVLINTKRGKPGKPRFSADYFESVTTFSRLPKMTDGITYMNLANEALTTRGDAPKYTPEYIANTLDGKDPYLYPNVNWMDKVFKDRGHNRKATVNIDGGAPSA
ncbi:MAG TPA: TonB-dependent receptor plug domain-containing protein, partial [Hanamia sp.]|nr:TonB-dependent receptor plug domain-containing protein [Hanamia sp.]